MRTMRTKTTTGYTHARRGTRKIEGVALPSPSGRPPRPPSPSPPPPSTRPPPSPSPSSAPSAGPPSHPPVARRGAVEKMANTTNGEGRARHTSTNEISIVPPSDVIRLVSTFEARNESKIVEKSPQRPPCPFSFKKTRHIALEYCLWRLVSRTHTEGEILVTALCSRVDQLCRWKTDWHIEHRWRFQSVPITSPNNKLRDGRKLRLTGVRRKFVWARVEPTSIKSPVITSTKAKTTWFLQTIPENNKTPLRCTEPTYFSATSWTNQIPPILRLTFPQTKGTKQQQQQHQQQLRDTERSLSVSRHSLKESESSIVLVWNGLFCFSLMLLQVP